MRALCKGMQRFAGRPGTVVLLACLALAGCGGGGSGGGGNGGGGAASGAQLLPNPTSVTISAQVTDDAPQFTISVSMSNVPTTGKILSIRYSTHGISSAGGDYVLGTSAQVYLYFKAPAGLAPGVYTDQVRLRICQESGCANVIAGSDVLVPVTYTVTAPGSGAPAMHFATSHYALLGHLLTPSGVSDGPSTLAVDFSLENLRLMPYLHVTSSGPAIAVDSVSTPNAQQGSISVSLARPAILGVGTFHNTLTITACVDASCANPLAGSPYTIDIDYEIADTYSVAGAGGYSWRTVLPGATDVAWDAATARLYATTGSSSATAPQSLVAIDPATATIAWSMPLGGDSGSVVASGDGRYAYVEMMTPAHAIAKIDLATHAVLATTPLASDLQVYDMQVAPGAPDVLALGAFVAGASHSVILLGATPADASSHDVADTGASAGRFSIAWGATAGTLYAYGTLDDALLTFHPAGAVLGAPTVATVDLNGDRVAWSRIHFDRGMLLESHGALFDVASGSVVAQVPPHTPTSTNVPPYFCVAALDVALQRAYYWYVDDASMTVQAMDLTTAQSIGYIRTGSRSTGRLIRWGTNGLAYIDSTGDGLGVAIISGALVGP